jgi:hypothetical protein
VKQGKSTGGLLEVGFLIMAAVLAMHHIYDPDFWYHLAVGDRILKADAVLRENFFSFTFPHHPWIDTSWLYEVILSSLWMGGRAAAVVSFKVALNVALAALVLWGLRDGSRPLTTIEAVVLVMSWLLMLPRLSDRPELISFVLLAVMLALLRQHRGWWCLPVQALWANVHSFFIFGPVLAGGWAIGELLRGQRRAALKAMVVALACGAASALSPFGWRNFQAVRAMLASGVKFNHLIEESVSPFHPVGWTADGTGWLLVVFLAAAVLLLTKGRRSVMPFDWLVSVATLPLALTMKRGVPVFVLCSLPALLSCAAAMPELRTRRVRTVLLILMLTFTTDFAAGTSYLMRFRNNERAFGWGVSQRRLPEGAALFVREHVRTDARFLNAPFHTGNYLMWRWQGQPAVFVDGRTPAYLPEFWDDSLATLSDEVIFNRFTQGFRISHLFIGLDTAEGRAFVQGMATNMNWRQVYADRAAVVFERVGKNND